MKEINPINKPLIRYRSVGELKNSWRTANSLDEILNYDHYIVEITHGDDSVSLPIPDCGREHYIVAHLFVTDCGTAGAIQTNRISGQILLLSNCHDNQTKIYTRTHNAGNTPAWSEWTPFLNRVATDKIEDSDDLSAVVESLAEELRNEIARAADADTANEAQLENIANRLDKEIAKLKNGDTVVGMSRDVYTRQGKTDSATFLKRTTAGSTSVSDGMATLKQVGGNIVKNLVDGTFSTGWTIYNGSKSLDNGVLKITSISATGQCGLNSSFGLDNKENNGHIYYQSCCIRCTTNPNGKVYFGHINSSNERAVSYVLANNTLWQFGSIRYKSSASGSYVAVRVADNRKSDWGNIYIKNYFFTDLTEMFGSGKEPSQEECDRMFSTMGPLPSGLTIVKPTVFKSVGYNQWNPDNKLSGEDGTTIAVVECLPCKIGVGENNGYVIGCGEGDNWSDSAIQSVFFTPLNPMENHAELHLQKIEKDETFGTYVPQCAGWLLIYTKETTKLCVHLHWSGDRDYRDYEEYIESTINLPEIPEMSEWGLAGVQGYSDIIDLENRKYIKRITTFKIPLNSNWIFSRFNEKGIFYTPFTYEKATIHGMSLNTKFQPTTNLHYGLIDYDMLVYTSDTKRLYIKHDNSVVFNDDGCLNESESSKKLNAFLATLSESDRTVFCVLRQGEEYPIPVKSAPNYIASDYGVEEFSGVKIPLASNNLFYMRSLVGEVRNFFDRLQSALGLTDVTSVANKIASSINISELETSLSDNNEQ